MPQCPHTFNSERSGPGLASGNERTKIMNNNLYNWHDNYMVELEMREMHRNLEYARMLKEAGIPGETWAVRAVKSLGRMLSSVWAGRRERQLPNPAARQSECENLPC